MVSANDNIGGQIVALGVYDLALTESLWRLCEPGETALDVGANIGYTVNVMAHRLQNGTIHAFEPHPTVFNELSANIALLQTQGFTASIFAHQCALGREPGELPLHIPADFEKHRGESSLAMLSHLAVDPGTYRVKVDTLSNQTRGVRNIGVMKIDVEGFELEVFAGGRELFENKCIRDCVFEEHGVYPTPVTEWFLERGYKVYRIDRSFGKPLLLDPTDSKLRTNWTASNYLATTDSARAVKLFAKGGWNCLKA